jgi:hypothetical protein
MVLPDDVDLAAKSATAALIPYPTSRIDCCYRAPIIWVFAPQAREIKVAARCDASPWHGDVMPSANGRLSRVVMLFRCVVVVGRDGAMFAMSALRPEAVIWACLQHVCFVPQAEEKRLFNYLVGAQQ